MIEIALGLAIAFVVSACARRALAWRRAAHGQREAFRTRFFSLAEQIVTHPQADLDLLDRVQSLAETLQHAIPFRRVLRAAEQATQTLPRLTSEPLREQVRTLAYLTVMAASYDHWISGVLLRGRFMVLLDPALSGRIPPSAGWHGQSGVLAQS